MELTCPKCHGKMRQYERGGVTVDQCNECRGIFLDRGELEKLIDAENSWHGGQAAPAPQAYQPQPQAYQQQSHGGYTDRGHSGYGHPQKKKRKSFLDELFD